MSTFIFLGLGSLFAVSYLFTIWFQHEQARKIIKAIPILCWCIAVWLTLPQDELFIYYLLVGLLFSALGDLFLLNHSKHFIKGLASFLIAHIVYIIGFLSIHSNKEIYTDRSSLICLTFLTLAALLYMWYIRPHIMQQHQSISFLLSVYAYILIISSMVYIAWLTSQDWLIIGALLFYLSDFTLSWNKFVREFKSADLIIMSTYYGAQVSFVIGYIINK